jgi:hypothetical protein
MVRFYKLVKNTAAIIVATNTIATKSTAPSTEAKGKHRLLTPKNNKWPQPTQPPKWRKQQKEGANIITRRAQLIASNTGKIKKQRSIKQPATHPTTPKNKRERQTKQQREERGYIHIHFATQKKKNSFDWQYMFHKISPPPQPNKQKPRQTPPQPR